MPVVVALVLNFLIPLGVVSLTLPTLVELVFAINSSYRTWLALLLGSCFSALFVWQCFGLLRTADLKTSETGERLWSTGVQILIVVSVLFVIVLGVGVFQQITALKLAEREKGFLFSRSYQLIVDNKNHSIKVSGELEPGVTRDLSKLIDENVQTLSIELNSSGGQIYEGRGLYRVIKQRGLNTLVTDSCLSACTMAFLGGVERRVGAKGEIGFHQYKTYSVQPNIDVAKEQARDEKLMLLQGVSREFVKEVFNASPDDIWLPSHRDLHAAGVINIDPE